MTQFLHLLHLYFLFLFVCNFHHNLTSNSRLRCHMTRCCSKCSFELSCLFPRWWAWVHNESDAFDQSFWYFGIGMFCTESGFSLTFPKLRLEVCCQGKVHSRQMNGVEKVHFHLTKFCNLSAWNVKIYFVVCMSTIILSLVGRQSHNVLTAISFQGLISGPLAQISGFLINLHDIDVCQMMFRFNQHFSKIITANFHVLNGCLIL